MTRVFPQWGQSNTMSVSRISAPSALWVSSTSSLTSSAMGHLLVFFNYTKKRTAAQLPRFVRRPCRSASSGLLRDFDEVLEAGGIVDRDLAEHLAVEGHARLDEAGDELRVADAFGAGRRVDTGDPELTEVALLQLAVLGRKAHRAIDGLRRDAEQLGTGSVEAFCQLKAAAAAFAGSGSMGNTHCLLLLLISDPGAHARRSW